MARRHCRALTALYPVTFIGISRVALDKSKGRADFGLRMESEKVQGQRRRPGEEFGLNPPVRGEEEQSDRS
jgi:hypothetical protein